MPISDLSDYISEAYTMAIDQGFNGTFADFVPTAADLEACARQFIEKYNRYPAMQEWQAAGCPVWPNGSCCNL